MNKGNSELGPKDHSYHTILICIWRGIAMYRDDVANQPDDSRPLLGQGSRQAEKVGCGGNDDWVIGRCGWTTLHQKELEPESCGGITIMLFVMSRHSYGYSDYRRRLLLLFVFPLGV